MASVTVDLTATFPEGTSVAAYPAWGAGLPPAWGTSPVGSATQTVTVTSGRAVFTALAPETDYYVAGQVSASYRYARISTRGQVGAFGGRELDYAEITADVTRADTTPTDSGLVINPVIGTRPVELEFFGMGQLVTASGIMYIYLKDVTGGTTLGTATLYGGAVANFEVPLVLRRRVTPAAGARQYKIQVQSFDTKTVKLLAGDGTGANPPAFLRAREL